MRLSHSRSRFSSFTSVKSVIGTSSSSGCWSGMELLGMVPKESPAGVDVMPLDEIVLAVILTRFGVPESR